MTEKSQRLNDSEIGERLRVARESAKLTQSEAAETIDVARTTLVAIEQGQRRVRMDELQRLAIIYKTSANSILRRESVHLDMVPRFRKLPQSTDGAVEAAARILNDLVSAEVELENLLGIKRTRNYPPERQILPGDVHAQAELDAQDLRNWLGLGPGPVLDVVALLELHMGIRVYLVRLGSICRKISGMFAFDDESGACILLNADQPMKRLRQTAIHELAHLISARRQPEALTDDETYGTRVERYAKYFAQCFLTPAREVRQKFADITAGQKHFTRRHVIILAHAFGVSREAIVRRLEGLDLVKPGTWDWFESNGGITDKDVKEVVGNLAVEDDMIAVGPGGIPPRIALLAREAWRREMLSEGQLAHLLNLNRLEIREILDGAESEVGEANEIVRLTR